MKEKKIENGRTGLFICPRHSDCLCPDKKYGTCRHGDPHEQIEHKCDSGHCYPDGYGRPPVYGLKCAEV